MSSLKRFLNSVGRRQRRTFATLPVLAGAELLAAALDRFLVLGIFTNLAIIKNKVMKTFSLLRVKYLRSQSNDSALTNLKEYSKLLGRSWKRLFLRFFSTKKFPAAAKISQFLVTCQTTIVQEN